MTKKYFFIDTRKKLIRYFKGVTEEFSKGDWVEKEEWYNRIFFSDFTDYREISEDEAIKFMKEGIA